MTLLTYLAAKVRGHQFNPFHTHGLAHYGPEQNKKKTFFNHFFSINIFFKKNFLWINFLKNKLQKYKQKLKKNFVLKIYFKKKYI